MKRSSHFLALTFIVVLSCYQYGLSQLPLVSISGTGNCTGTVLTLSSSINPSQITWKQNGTAVYTTNAYWSPNATTIGIGQGSANNQFNYPFAVFVDSSGNIYVADENNHRVQKWAAGATTSITVAGGNGAGSAANQLNSPLGVFVDNNGNVYVADAGNRRVQKWVLGATTGTTVAGGNGNGSAANQFSGGMSVFVDNSSNLYIADGTNNRVQKWAAGATTGITVAGGNGLGSAPDQLSYPWSVFVDAGGNMFIADGNNFRIQKWQPGATSGTTVAGGNGGGMAANQVYTPTSIYVDGNGNLYIDELYTYRVTKWAPSATSGITIAGGNGSGSASNQLSNARGLFLDYSGNLYVADVGNNRVQKFSVNDTMTFTAANAGSYTATVTTFGGQSATTSAYTISPTVTPSLVISVSPGNIITAGSSVTFTAVPTNGGTSPSFQWKINGNNIGTNSSTFTSNTLNNGDLVTCVLTSNAPCITQATANSNSINIVTPIVSVSGTTNCPGSVLTVSSNINPLRTVWSRNGSVIQTVNAIWNANATTVAGQSSGTAGSGLTSLNLGGGGGVYSDTGGNVYVADINNNRVVKWTPGSTSGIVVAGGNGAGAGLNQLNHPSGVYADAAGNVYVADANNNRIVKWAPGATTGALVAGGNGAGSGANQVNAPQNVKVDVLGNIYIPDGSNNRVQKWAPGATSGVTVAGQSSGIAGSGNNQLNLPEDIFIDTAGNIYVADGNNHRIIKWTPGATSGTTVAAGNGQGSGNNQLNGPTGVYVDYFGNVYISDGGNARVMKWALGATTGSVIAGGNGAGVGANQLNGPIDLYFDASGNMYVADGANNRVQKFTYSSSSLNYTATLSGNYTATITTFSGAAATTSSWLINPTPDITTAAITPNIVCSNVPLFDTLYFTVPGTTFTWTRAAVYGISNPASSGTGNFTETLIDTLPNIATATYHYVLTANGCTNSLISTSVQIRPIPLMSNASLSASSCNNSPFSFTPTSATTGTSFAWTRAAISGISNPSSSGNGNPNETLSDTTVNPVTTYYNYTLSANGCTNPTTYTINATVNPTPVLISSALPLSSCSNTAFTYTPASSTSGASYTWSRAAVTGIITPAASGTGGIGETLVNSTGNPVVVNYIYSVGINGCFNPSTYNISDTVYASPSILSQPSNDTVCSGNNASYSVSATGTGISYQWQVNTGSGFNDISSPGIYTGATTNSLTISNAGIAMNGYLYRCKVSGMCVPPAISNAAVLSIRTSPSITSQFSYATICPYDDVLFHVTATGSGLTYQWYQNNLPLSDTANVTGSHGYSLILAYEPPYGNGNVYKCVVTGLCSPPVTSTPVTLVIGTNVIISGQPLGHTICEGTTTNFSVTATGTNLTYQWKENGISLSNGGVYSGATSATLIITGATSSMSGNLYTCLVSGLCGGHYSDTVALVVNTIPVISTQPANTATCAGTAVSIFISAAGTSIAYQWKADTGTGYYNIINSAQYSGVTSNTLTLLSPTTQMNGYRYKCVITGTCGTTTSIPDTLTINTPPAITSQTSAASICVGSNTTFAIIATGGGLVYQWKVNTGTGFVNITNNSTYSGANTSMLTISGATTAMNGYLYQCSVSGACVPAALSSAMSLTVITPPSILTAPAGSIACEGTNTSFSVAASGGNLTYQWFVNSGSGFVSLSNGGVYSGVTTNVLSLTGVTASMNGYQYQCAISGLCSPPATTVPVILFINLVPTINTQPSAIGVCVGSGTSFSVGASGTALSYQWQLNSGSGFVNLSNGGLYGGVNTATLSVTGATLGINGYLYRCVASGACTPPANSNSALLTVYTTPSFTAQPVNTTVCVGDSVFLTAIAAAGSGAAYQWQLDTGTGFSNLVNNSIYGGTTAFKLSIANTPSSYSGFHYRCIITGNCSPADTSVSVTLTVNKPPSILTQPFNTSVCAGSNVSIPLSATGSGLVYQWKVDTGTGFFSIYNTGVYSNATTNSLTISGATVSMNGYHYKCVISGACSPPDTSSSVILTVNTAPAIGSPIPNDTACAGTNPTFTVAATGSGLVYQWQVYSSNAYANLTDNALYSGTSTNTLTISNVPDSLNGKQYRCNISGTCTPALISNAPTLTVYSLPGVTSLSSNDTICAGANASFTISGTGTGVSYQWQQNSGTGFTNITNGTIYSGAQTNTLILTAVPASMNGYSYRCLLSGACLPVAISGNVNLTVNTAPSLITPSSNSTICAGANTGFTVAATGTGLTYQWQLNTGSGFTSLTNSSIYSGSTTNSLNISNAPSSMNGYIFRCLVSGVCNPPVFSFADTLVVNSPLSFVTQHLADTTVCAGTSIIFSVQLGGTIQSYQWQINYGNGFINISNGGFYSGVNSATLLISGTNTSLSGNLYRCIISGPCTAGIISNTATLTVNPVPLALALAAGPVLFCPGDSVELYANTGSGLTYQWQLNNVNIPGISNASSFMAYAAGVYTLVVTNTNNCAAVSAPITVTQYPSPAAVMTPAGVDTMCSNDTLTLFVNSGTNLSYQWRLGTQDIFAATDTVYRTSFAGVYTVAVTNSYGCSSISQPLALTVNYIAIPPLYTVYGYPVFCAGDSLTLGTNVLYSAYQWQRNGINIPGATTVSYTTHLGGDYRVIANTPQCSAASSAITAVVNPLPFDSLISTGKPVICSATGSYTFSAFPVAGQLYQWYKNGLIIYGATSTQYSATSVGGYNVQISSAQGCAIFTNSIDVIAVNSPVPVITAIGLTLYTDTFYSGYQWYLNNVPVGGANADSFNVLQNGDYTVFVTDTNGCSNMSAKYNVSSLGIYNTTMSGDDIKIYPNPATRFVYINAPGVVDISIDDLGGRTVLQNINAKSIDLSVLSNGVYLIKVYDEHHTLLKTDRLVKNAW